MGIILLPCRGIKGNQSLMAPLFPDVVYEPVAYGRGSIRQKCPSSPLIPLDRLIKGKHGHTKLVLPDLCWNSLGKADCLCLYEIHILANQAVSSFRTLLCLIDQTDYLVLFPQDITSIYHRIRRNHFCFGVTGKLFSFYFPFYFLLSSITEKITCSIHKLDCTSDLLI